MILYRLARNNGPFTEYRWSSDSGDQGVIQKIAHSVFLNNPYSLTDWVVIGATSAERLEESLRRINCGLPSCSARLRRFLQGVLDEESVLKWEERRYSYEGGEVSTYIRRAFDTALEKVFIDEKAPESQQPHPTTEEGEPRGDAPPKIDPARGWEDKGKLHSWYPPVKKRLKFMRWLVQRGVFEEDMKAEA